MQSAIETQKSTFFLIRWFHIFTHAILGSLTDLNYYVQILNTRVKTSIKIFVVFYLLLGLVLTGVFLMRDIPRFNQKMNDARNQLVQEYPQDLNFTWKDQTLGSSSTEPIIMPYPRSFEPPEDAPKNLATIDTRTSDGPLNVSSFIFVNQKKMYVNSPQGGWNESELINFLENDEQFLDKARLIELAEESKNTQAETVRLLPWLAFLSLTLGLCLVRLINIFFNAILIQFFFQMLNKPLAYKKVFQLAMHVMIPAEIVNQITAFAFPELQLPMLSLSFWMITILVLWHLRHLHVVKFELRKNPEDLKNN